MLLFSYYSVSATNSGNSLNASAGVQVDGKCLSADSRVCSAVIRARCGGSGDSLGLHIGGHGLVLVSAFAGAHVQLTPFP